MDFYIYKNIHVMVENFVFKVVCTELFISVTTMIIELFLRRDLSFADEKNTDYFVCSCGQEGQDIFK